MILKLNGVLDRVKETNMRLEEYRLQAMDWERMWKGDPGFKDSLPDAVKQGREQVILPTPYNTLHLAQRLIAPHPKIQVVPADYVDQEQVKYQEICQKFLTAMWTAVSYQQRRNIIKDLHFINLLRGRHALEIKWVKEALPPMRRKRGFPIMIRPLDPINVGYHQGPLYMEYVYHCYEAPAIDIIQRYPNLKNARADSELKQIIKEISGDNRIAEQRKVKMVDFWYIDSDSGDVRNVVLAQDEIAIPDRRTDYPDLPIIVGRGDSSPMMGESHDGVSILHPMKGLWEFQCRLSSMMATGVMEYFWPPILISSEHGEVPDDIEVGPGKTTYLPMGVTVNMPRPDPNAQLAMALYSQIDAAVQQSGFPGVMYGQAPGELQAGYGVSILADSAKGRVVNFVQSLEFTISDANKFVLALIEEMTTEEEPVHIWGMDMGEEIPYPLSISRNMIAGNYENHVDLSPRLEPDNLQKITMGIQLADKRYISNQTLRDKYVAVDLPSDETRRVALEEAFQSEQLAPWRMRVALIDAYGFESARQIIATSPELLPPGMVLLPNGAIQPDPAQQMQPGMGGPMEGPMGPPQGGPPMPGMGGPMGGPQGVQPPGVPTAQGGGIPPAMAGQIEAENLGLDPTTDPVSFAQIMGNPLSIGEISNRLRGR